MQFAVLLFCPAEHVLQLPLALLAALLLLQESFAFLCLRSEFGVEPLLLGQTLGLTIVVVCGLLVLQLLNF